MCDGYSCVLVLHFIIKSPGGDLGWRIFDFEKSAASAAAAKGIQEVKLGQSYSGQESRRRFFFVSRALVMHTEEPCWIP